MARKPLTLAFKFLRLALNALMLLASMALIFLALAPMSRILFGWP